MKKYFLIFFVLYNFSAKAQSYNSSGSCNINVNSAYSWSIGDLYDGPERATVKILIPPFDTEIRACSGTLINIDDKNQTELGQGRYFLTAKHCIDGKDANGDFVFLFNYQSKNDNNSSVPANNSGRVPEDALNDSNGYRYRLVSRVNIVSKGDDYHDYVLLHIVEPIPPHFDPFFVGWTNNRAALPLDFPFVGIHHPKGDIKKVCRTYYINTAVDQIATGCRTVTKVVDFFFGWIWGRKYLTEVLCDYMDYPWYLVPRWGDGTTEGGSFGSGIFDRDMRYFGTLSNGLATCSFTYIDQYTKFPNSYNLGLFKTLNPSRDWYTDQFGIPGRNINCYDNLPNLSGQYYPINEYNTYNHLTLRSSQMISNTGDLKIYSGADFTFQAGTNIVLTPGFEVDNGATFIAKPGVGCSTAREASEDAKNKQLIKMIGDVKIPKYKLFKIEDYLTASELAEYDNNLFFSIYPNPNNGLFTIKSNFKESYNLQVLDGLGRIYLESMDINQPDFQVDISKENKGIYFVKIITASGIVKTKKIINH